MEFGGADFGEAVVASSARGRHPVYLHKLANGRTLKFQFRKSSSNGIFSYNICAACNEMHRRNPALGPPPRVTVAGNRFVTDPVAGSHSHYCLPADYGTVVGQHARYEAIQLMKHNRSKKPKQAFMEAVNSVNDRPDLTTAEKESMSKALIGRLGYRGIRRSFQKAARGQDRVVTTGSRKQGTG